MRISVAISLASLPAAPLYAQWLKYPTPGIPRTSGGKPDLSAPAPRLADGKPDLSGIWRAHAGGYALDVTSDLKPGEIFLFPCATQGLPPRASEVFVTACLHARLGKGKGLRTTDRHFQV